jgi:hypothetical protein
MRGKKRGEIFEGFDVIGFSNAGNAATPFA